MSDIVEDNVSVSLPEALEIVFLCLKELDVRIKKLEEGTLQYKDLGKKFC